MALSHGSATRTAICNAAVDQIDAGGGGAGQGKFKWRETGGAVVCTITLPNPAFGAASGATAVLNGVPLQGTVTSTSTLASFIITDSGDVTVMSGTVGISGADVNVSSVAVGINDILQIDGINYTACP
jgi:hypothetical protein